jgi:light-regulated signal transduction histidine kinase (bacteriophytochrome)
LNEPLRTIANFLHLLTRRTRDTLTTEAQEYVAFAVDGAQRMQQMITDLLAYTRAGGRELAFTPVDCEMLLAHTLADLQATIEESGATITHDSLPSVTGDAVSLGLVLQNLIGNALKFRSAAPTQVHVSAQHQDHHWQFSVCDNGIGIEPAHVDRIFQVFKRLHTPEEYQGTGIGLAICKRVIERHGGRIWVESTPGHGSTFCFTLPG